MHLVALCPRPRRGAHRHGAVLIRGERIERVGPAAGMTADQVIDLGSATILPGLIDLHTHLTDEVPSPISPSSSECSS